jgi:hypothetical protein
MARFYGPIGYSNGTTETTPGIWEETVTEYNYYGDVLRNTRRLEGAEVNNNLVVNNSISIVADAYATNNFFAMRYVVWMGTKWVITNVEVQSPRLILNIGGVYNGPTA